MTPKFRAWLPRQGKMVDVTKITFVEGKVNCVFYSAKYSSDTISACYEGITFELMQSTGLTDCKGKEIYEGDIVFWQWGQLDDVGIGNNVFTNCGKKIVDSDLQTLVMLEEVKKLKFARCKNCKWFSREPIEGKWPHKGSGLSTIQGEKRLLNKGFGRCINDKVDEQAFFYDDEQVGFGQSDYPGKVDYAGMMIDCSTNECGFLFHETFGCVNFEKREAENEEH